MFPIRKTTHPFNPARTESATGAKAGRHRIRRRSTRADVRRRLRATGASVLALSTLSLGFGAPAQGAPSVVEFQYTTTIDATPAGGAPDAPVRITYRFDTGLAPGGEPSETFAAYGPLNRVIVQIGDQCVALSGAGTEITVFNDAGNTPEDSYDVRADAPATTGKSLFGLEFRFFRFLLVDPGATMFADTSLPSTPAFAAGAGFQQIQFNLMDGRRRVNLAATDVAPGELRSFDPLAAIASIRAQVQATNLNHGHKTALQNPLEKAAGYLSDGKKADAGKAIKELQKFTSHVLALPGSAISESDRANLTRAARATIASLPTCS